MGSGPKNDSEKGLKNKLSEFAGSLAKAVKFLYDVQKNLKELNEESKKLRDNTLELAQEVKYIQGQLDMIDKQLKAEFRVLKKEVQIQILREMKRPDGGGDQDTT